jgi:TonB-dependent receptor
MRPAARVTIFSCAVGFLNLPDRGEKMNYRSADSLRWISTFILILLTLGHAQPAPAQGQKGAISGIVTDESGAVLKGAQVTLESPVFNTVSDEQGRFYINDVAPGSYTLTISYLGFTKLEQPVSVSAGQAANIEAKLKLQSQNESILVTAERVTGEAEAVNIERNADNLVQVMPAEVIRSLPNANLADALGRLPSVTLERDEGEGKYVQVRGLEPRLTNATIDGVNVPSAEPGFRQVKFDAIPADMVESVQVSKTLQPNMEGDGIGGSVNLITKVATEQPTISLSSIGGYTPIINGRGLTEDTGTIGYRFGPDKKFGALIGGSYDWNGRGIDDVEPVPDVATLASGQQVSWKDGMDVREYQYFRTRWGLSGSTDYKISEASNIYLRAFYSDFHNYGDRFKYSLTDNTPGIQLLAPGNVGCGTDSSGVTIGPCTGTPTANGELRNPDIGVSNIVLGGVHNLTSTWFAWDVAVSRGWFGNSSSEDADFKANPNTFTTSTCQYDPANTSNEFLPRWNGECFNEINNPSNYVLKDIRRNLGLSAQLNIEASGSGAKRYHLGSKLATLEIGGRFRNAHKFNDGYQLTLNPDTTALQNSSQFSTGFIPMSTFPNAMANHSYYNGGNYNLGYQPSFENAFAFYNANPTLFDSSSTQGTDGQEYDLIEKVSAGYVMNSIDLSSRWRLIAGLRVESTTENGTNFLFNEVSNTVGPNKFTGSYITLLPSAALKYAVTPNDNLRFFYARGLSRPDPTEIAEAIDITTSGNGTFPFAIQLDNPSLKAETGDDIDVLYDHYFSTFGVFSAGYFYKFLHNPIVNTQTDLFNYTPPGGIAGNYQVSQPINAGSGWVTGVEVAYLQHFSSLPGAWAGLGLSANYGYTASRANGIPGRSDHPMLPRTSPNAFNFSPTYDRGRVSFRIGVSYNQASIYAFQFTDGLPGGVNGPLSDIWFYTHVQVDAQGSIRMNHGLTLVAYGLNLNNEVFGFYQGSQPFMIQREYYQPTISLGLRWEPRREK